MSLELIELASIVSGAKDAEVPGKVKDSIQRLPRKHCPIVVG